MLEKAARVSTFVWGTEMNRLQHLKNPQMKGYKNKVVVDKRHSNSHLTYKCGGFQQGTGWKQKI